MFQKYLYIFYQTLIFHKIVFTTFFLRLRLFPSIFLFTFVEKFTQLRNEETASEQPKLPVFLRTINATFGAKKTGPAEIFGYTVELDWMRSHRLLLAPQLYLV